MSFNASLIICDHKLNDVDVGFHFKFIVTQKFLSSRSRKSLKELVRIKVIKRRSGKDDNDSISASLDTECEKLYNEIHKSLTNKTFTSNDADDDVREGFQNANLFWRSFFS